jgi:hypothetical protein
MANSSDNATIETMTFIAGDESKPSSVKEGFQATRMWRTMEVRCRLVCVCVCLQVTNLIDESDNECDSCPTSTCESVDLPDSSQSISRWVSKCFGRYVEAMMGLVSENVWLVYGRQPESESNTRDT